MQQPVRLAPGLPALFRYPLRGLGRLDRFQGALGGGEPAAGQDVGDGCADVIGQGPEKYQRGTRVPVGLLHGQARPPRRGRRPPGPRRGRGTCRHPARHPGHDPGRQRVGLIPADPGRPAGQQRRGDSRRGRQDQDPRRCPAVNEHDGDARSTAGSTARPARTIRPSAELPGLVASRIPARLVARKIRASRAPTVSRARRPNAASSAAAGRSGGNVFGADLAPGLTVSLTPPILP